MKKVLVPHPDPAKKTKSRTVTVIAVTNMPNVEPTRMNCQRLELLCSQLSKHVSDHV